MLQAKLVHYIGIGLAVLALIAVIVLGVVQCKKVDQQGDNVLIDAGTTKERATTQGETINAISNARQVVEQPSAVQLNVVCSKYDRNCPHGS